MKNNLPVIKHLILCGFAIFILQSHGKKSKNITIDYKIKGVSQIKVANDNSPLTRTVNTYNVADKITAHYSILHNPKLIRTKYWTDEVTKNNKQNEVKVLVQKSVLKSTLRTDTFYLLQYSNNIHKFKIEGNIQAKLLSIKKQSSDSLHFTINQTFADTIIINCICKQKAEKMAYHIVQKVLHNAIHKEIVEQKDKITR